MNHLLLSSRSGRTSIHWIFFPSGESSQKISIYGGLSSFLQNGSPKVIFLGSKDKKFFYLKFILPLIYFLMQAVFIFQQWSCLSAPASCLWGNANCLWDLYSCLSGSPSSFKGPPSSSRGSPSQKCGSGSWKRRRRKRLFFLEAENVK